MQDTMRERVIVAPCDGRFASLPPEVLTAEGEWIEPGQTVARIEKSREAVPVRSTFRGWLMGGLALEGQPVDKGEALFWIRTS